MADFRPEDEQATLELLSREELEDRIRDRTAYLENLMDTMVDVLLRVDTDGEIEMANEALGEVLGYEEAEVVGKPIDVIFAPPAENEQLSDMLTKGAFLKRLLTEGQVNDVEIYFSTKDGKSIPMSVSASVIEGEDGGVSGIVCVAKDISERKEAEETAEFLHSLLRHDLGNKLQVTHGNLRLVRDRPGEAEDYLDDAIASIDQAIELIENVRTLHKIDGEQELRPVALADELDACVERHEDLRTQQGMTIDVQVDDDLRVRAGPLLTELFANLVENALVHSGGSRIEITAEETADEVVVTIRDDGEGISDEEKERIFRKGVSGKDSAGSGLGMHLAARIAEEYGGGIEVSDADLGGARFDVVLPKPDDGRVGDRRDTDDA